MALLSMNQGRSRINVVPIRHSGSVSAADAAPHGSPFVDVAAAAVLAVDILRPVQGEISVKDSDCFVLRWMYDVR